MSLRCLNDIQKGYEKKWKKMEKKNNYKFNIRAF